MQRILKRINSLWSNGINQSRAEFVFLGSSVLVGVLTAFGAILFVALLTQIQNVTTYFYDLLGAIGLIAIMVLSGLLVGYLIEHYASEAKGHGVPEVMEAVAVRGGRIRGRVAAIKVLASSLTIGTGGSAGREGPIVQVGSALGSSLGRFLNLSDEQVQILVACGAAAGISATFNAPIAGSLFAMEVILGRLTVRNFGAVVISAVSASVISRSFWGNEAAFVVPAYSLNNMLELPLYILLGVAAAFVSVLFIRILYKAEMLFDRWPVPLPIRAAVGMALTASLIFVFPEREVFGSGLHLIGEMIAGDIRLPLASLGLLLIGKLVATTFTLGSGNSGGVFAPSLFMGAVLGGIIGTIGEQLWPTIVLNPGAYAIVGMAAVFAGSARAPITSILIVFEMSGDYKLILPLMLSAVLATIIAELIFSESIYTLKLKLKGINLYRGRDEDVLKSVMVRDIMRPITNPLKTDTSIAELFEVFSQAHIHGLPILDEQGNLWGVITLEDIEDIRGSETNNLVVADLATPFEKLILTYPDETIDVVLRRMKPRALGHIPVVAKDSPRRLLGFLRREDILRAYELALVRRDAGPQSSGHKNQISRPGMVVTDVIITANSSVKGKIVSSIAHLLPEKCVLVSIQRDNDTIVPHGDTLFQQDDVVTIFVEKILSDQTRLIFSNSDPLPLKDESA